MEANEITDILHDHGPTAGSSWPGTLSPASPTWPPTAHPQRPDRLYLERHRDRDVHPDQRRSWPRCARTRTSPSRSTPSAPPKMLLIEGEPSSTRSSIPDEYLQMNGSYEMAAEQRVVARRQCTPLRAHGPHRRDPHLGQAHRLRADPADPVVELIQARGAPAGLSRSPATSEAGMSGTMPVVRTPPGEKMARRYRGGPAVDGAAVPELGDDDVLVAVDLCSICGSDLHMCWRVGPSPAAGRATSGWARWWPSGPASTSGSRVMRWSADRRPCGTAVPDVRHRHGRRCARAGTIGRSDNAGVRHLQAEPGDRAVGHA